MNAEKILEVFNHMHDNPELSNEEYETTDYIFDYLEREGFSPVRFKNITGLYCDMGTFSDEYATIGIRADIDELYEEVVGLKWANNSCGYDATPSIIVCY